MQLYLLNIILSLGWAGVTGEFSPLNIVFGFFIGFGALWLSKPLFEDQRYFQTFGRLLGLAFFFLKELLTSTFQVALAVIWPGDRIKPGIIALPLDAKTDIEIVMLANMITLTPGTQSIDVSKDRKTLYIHSMFTDDPDKVIRSIKDGFERRIIEAF